MSALDQTRARLSRLLLERVAETDALGRVRDELATYRPMMTDGAERPVLAVVAVDLHDYYTATEALFERIARLVDGAVPDGSESHRALVDQMAADLPPLRGPVIPPPLRTHLHTLRRFRRFFRHASAVPLDVAQLRDLTDGLLANHRQLVAALEGFFAFVMRTRDGLGPEDAVSRDR